MDEKELDQMWDILDGDITQYSLESIVQLFHDTHVALPPAIYRLIHEAIRLGEKQALQKVIDHNNSALYLLGYTVEDGKVQSR